MNYKIGLLFVFLLPFSLLGGNGISFNEHDSLSVSADSLVKDAKFKEGLRLYRSAYQLAFEQGDTSAMYAQLYKIGESYYTQGVFDSAKFYYKKIIDDLNGPVYDDIIADAQKSLAHVQWRMGDNISSLRNINASINYFNQVGDTSELIFSKTILGGIYISLGKLDESKDIYHDLLELAVEANDTTGITTCTEHLGIIAYFKGDFQEALDQYKKAYQFNLDQEKNIEAGINLGNIGEAYLELNNYEQALYYLNRSLEILNTFQFNSGIIFLYYTFGRTYTAMKKYALADEYYLKSIELMKFTGEVRERNYVYKLMSQSKEEQGVYSESLKYYKLFSGERDSLNSIERQRQFEDLKAQYQLAERLNENKLLTIQNQEAISEIDAKEKLIKYQFLLFIVVMISFTIFLFQFFVLRRNKRKLELSNKTKDRLFGIIAHDIKNPVNNLSAIIQLIERSKDQIEKDKLFRMLKQSSLAISELVKSILSWSISNSSEFHFSKTPLNMKELAEEALSLFIFQIENKNINVTNEIDPDFIVECDKDAISTILRNLISNAIKFTAVNGNISISAQKVNKYTTIKVKDNGMGMSEEVKENILSGHRNSSSIGTARESGTGVGFTFVLDLVMRLNGKIDINSEVNNGTEVIIHLPSNHSS